MIDKAAEINLIFLRQEMPSPLLQRIAVRGSCVYRTLAAAVLITPIVCLLEMGDTIPSITCPRLL